MLATTGYVGLASKALFQMFSFDRRNLGPHGIRIKISHCGICHSDIHQARDEWADRCSRWCPATNLSDGCSGLTRRQAVPSRGNCQRRLPRRFVRACGPCREGLEQYCETGMLLTYSVRDKKGRIMQGGYSRQIVVDENYVLRIPHTLSPAGAAPLLCAGIMTYSPSVIGASGNITSSP